MATDKGSGQRGAPSSAGPEARPWAPEVGGMPITLTLELRGLGFGELRCIPSSNGRHDPSLLPSRPCNILPVQGSIWEGEQKTEGGREKKEEVVRRRKRR